MWTNVENISIEQQKLDIPVISYHIRTINYVLYIP